jgi:hypothetical protein
MGEHTIDRHAPGRAEHPPELAWGHSFGEKLLCETCERGWLHQQIEPTPCPAPRVGQSKSLR